MGGKYFWSPLTKLVSIANGFQPAGGKAPLEGKLCGTLSFVSLWGGAAQGTRVAEPLYGAPQHRVAPCVVGS